MKDDDAAAIDRILSLIIDQKNGDLNKADREELENWVKTDPRNRELAEEVLEPEFVSNLLNQWKPEAANNSLATVKQRIRSGQKVRLWPRIAVAVAAAIALIILGVYFFNPQRHSEFISESPNYAKNDILPGKQGATLTLASGKKIKLTEAVNGELAKEAGVVISKTADGQLVYEGSRHPEAGQDLTQAKYNTLSTARGETYRVRLPDGSLVYLNAASSLTYTALLVEKGKRVVRLQGEGYFEITKDKSHPFIVKTDNQEVEVLGTHFNINSYGDEGSVKTTLLEGSVRVAYASRHAISARHPDADQDPGPAKPNRLPFSSGALNQVQGDEHFNDVVLKPGQQASLSNSGKILVEKVDVDNVVAWKKGYFQFEGEDLESIMRKVSRWYDVEVKFKDDRLKKLAFVGTVSRYKNVSQVLKTLQLTNALDFKIEGGTIVISTGIK